MAPLVAVIGLAILSGCASKPNLAADADEEVREFVQTTAPLQPTATAAAEPTASPLPTAISVVPAPSKEPIAAEPPADCLSSARFTTAATIVGNRVLRGSTDLLSASPVVVDLPSTAQWIVDDPTDIGHWFVVLDNGEVLRVDPAGTVSATGQILDEPPEVLSNPNNGVTVRSAYADHGLFSDPLPDTRVVGGPDVVALTGPTDRYGHGVLGDRIEASAIEIVRDCGDDRTRIEVPAPSVIEGVSAILADVNADLTPDILVTQSNADVGAWLAVYDLDGQLVAESEPIGQGNRWRNQMAVAATGPAGEVEVIDVRVPHIGGVVEFFQYRSDGRLERVATAPGEFTTHISGSRNLDMGVVLDATGNGQLNVVVPTQGRNQIGVLRRTTDAAHPTGVEVLGLIDLGGGRVVANFGTQATTAGPWLAIGTDDARLHIFGP